MGQAATKAAIGPLSNNLRAAAAGATTARAPAAAAAVVRGGGVVPPSDPPPPPPPVHENDVGAAAAAATANLVASSSRGRLHAAGIAAEVEEVASSSSSPGVGGGGGGVVPELPPDLLKFLNDAGPLRRVVDRELTSPRVYDALSSPGKAGDGIRDEHARMANSRIRRRMPLVRRDGEGGTEREKEKLEEEDDGTTTERTTNFSKVDRSSSLSLSSRGLGVTREDYYRILSTLGGGMGGGSETMEVGSTEWKGAVDDEYERMVSDAASAAQRASGTDDAAKNDEEKEEEGEGRKGRRSKTFDELRDAALFEDSLRYIGVPVLMRDDEGDIIGMWHHRVDDVRHSTGLKVVPEGSVQFVMRNEG
ncbi:hypothetical protein ACHAW5_003723 [Stephanodiscus triporus]|uniref:CBS domain-containing protein n=1 Tax=Stephanodiscus triporus TaxID=2934178 RepID=A0ABD3NQR6_9STRA